jgi:GMP synthase (glutamine-hydrolysing)
LSKLALAIRHEEIAHLGNLEPVLREHGYEIRYLDAATDSFDTAALDGAALDGADLVIVLGGDMGVYETDAHPFIPSELAFLRTRLDAQLPTLGVCLGAQMIAGALGASVHKGPTVEIGFRAVEPTDVGANSPLRHFAGVPVVQWHGDTFELPDGATLLASSEQYANEAYSIGGHVLAVQFHPELRDSMYDEWIEDGSKELEERGIPHESLREQRDRYAPAAEAASAAMLDEWLTSLER